MSLQRICARTLPGLLLLCASVAWAQAPAKPKYKQFAPSAALAAKYWPDARAEKEYYKSVYNVLRGRIPWTDAAKGTLDNWYKGKLLREFTMFKNLGKLPEQRMQLLKELKSASEPLASAYLKAEVLKLMTSFSQPRYGLHPAVRYNAMLLLGELNDMEAGARDAQDRRVPYPDPMVKAFDVLVSEFKSPNQMDAVKVAAQVGILRHAKLDRVRSRDRRIDGTKRKATVDTMLALVNGDAPAGRTAEGHTWMQRRGIEIMAALGAVGVVPAVHASLEKIVADDTKAMSLRCTAAEALSRWRPESQVKFDAKGLSTSLGRLGGRALLNELEIIGKLQESEELKDQMQKLIADKSTAMSVATSSAGGGAEGRMAQMMQMQGYSEGGDEEADEGGGGGMMEMSEFMGGADSMMALMSGGQSMAGAGPEDPRVTRSRRRLKHQLACVRAGLLGISRTSAAEPQKESIDAVINAINTAYTNTDPEGSDLPALEESIKRGLGALAFLMPEASADPLASDPTATADPAGAPPAPGASAVPAPGDPAAPPPAEPVSPAVPGEEAAPAPEGAAPAPADAAPAPAGAAPDPGLPVPPGE